MVWRVYCLILPTQRPQRCRDRREKSQCMSRNRPAEVSSRPAARRTQGRDRTVSVMFGGKYPTIVSAISAFSANSVLNPKLWAAPATAMKCQFALRTTLPSSPSNTRAWPASIVPSWRSSWRFGGLGDLGVTTLFIHPVALLPTLVDIDTSDDVVDGRQPGDPCQIKSLINNDLSRYNGYPKQVPT